MAKSETHSFHAPRAHGFVRVAAATPVVHVADPAANAEEHARLIHQAGEAGVDLLVFPELSLTGYAVDDLLLQDALLDAADSGFVLSGIYGREDSRVYAKPVTKGESTYLLTKEEKLALEDARKK